MAKLQLSDLTHGEDYEMPCSEDADRLCIHVKMTEISMKSVEALIHSDKGAFFSMWFEESGGRISIPAEGGRDRVFQFKIAQAQGGGQSRRGILECVHQKRDNDDDHQLRCLGPLEHRLTVQGTDDSYMQTKKKMEQAEIERNKSRAQEIKIFKDRSKSKKILTQPAERSISPAVRRPNRPVQPRPPPPSASLKHSTNKPSSGGGTGSPRPSHSLKDRVIHLLALKPQKRADLVARLKKETKRSETNMSKLDDILSDVGELIQGAYKLRSTYTNSVQVKDWPFYSEMERQMLKRKLVSEQAATETAAAAAKRPLPTTTVSTSNSSSSSSSTAASSTDSEPASKKPKLTIPDRSTLIPTPPLPIQQTRQTVFSSDAPQHTSLTITSQSNNSHSHHVHSMHHNLDSKMNGSATKTEKEVESSATFQPPPSVEKPMKKKKKKKPKHVGKEAGPTNAVVVTSDPTSTTNIPDYTSQFPPITSEDQRAHYKKVFGEDYEEYNSLKEHIETVSPECTTLSEKLDSLPRQSKEAKEVRQQIRTKYRELQPHKSRFDELHHKLDHIKKMVVAYDAVMYPT